MPAKMQALIAPPASMAFDFSQPAGWAASCAQWSGMMDARHPVWQFPTLNAAHQLSASFEGRESKSCRSGPGRGKLIAGGPGWVDFASFAR